jgi:electron transfer flavoprotein beta subunit
MRVGVCVRPVPDPEGRLWALDEGDEAALDAALQLGEALCAEVVALAAGPPRVEEGLRKALALGAAEALRIEVDEDSLADPAVTGRVLAAAARWSGVDLLVTGAQSTAAGSGLTGPATAAALGWPWVWLALRAEVEEAPGVATQRPAPRPALRVVQELEGRRRRHLRVELPALLAIQTGFYRPRMATIRGVLAAKRTAIETVDPSGLGLEPAALRPRLRRVALERPVAADVGVEWIDGGDPAVTARGLLARLREERIL